MKKLQTHFLTILFLSILFIVPLIGFISAHKEISVKENRALAKLPKLLETKYFQKIDLYLRDHFGFRETFINFYKNIKNSIKTKEGFKAVLGKNNWAFYSGCINHYEGKMDNKKIDDFIQKIKDLRSTFPKIPIIIIVVPNKTFIYEQYLPDYVVKNPQRFNTIKKLNYIKDINVLDLYPILKKARVKTFMKNDTHWNGVGAYIAYKEIINFINSVSSFNFTIKQDIKEIQSNIKYSGDISSMLDKKDIFVDDNNEVVFKTNFANIIKKTKSKVAQIPDFKNSKGNKNVLIFHDSFTQKNLGKYLAETFYTLKTFWSFDFKKNYKNIIKINPDLILIEIVDRHI